MNALFPLVYLTSDLFAESIRLLATFAEREDAEGVVYWFGFEDGRRAVVTSVIVPNADTRFGNVSTSAAANAEALSVITDTPLVLVGQAHSHPRAWVGHSIHDDRETFAQFPGALSVVVPWFGRRPVTMDECGVHRIIDGRYVQIDPEKVAEHLRLIPGTVDCRSRVRKRRPARS
jgi:hypothetical protein